MISARSLCGVLAVGAIVVSGCGLMPSASPAPDDTLPPIPAASARPPGFAAAGAGNRTDMGWIDSCIRYVQHGAFAGDVELAALWSAADQDDNTIRALCEGLTGPDFAALRDIPLTTVSSASSRR